MKKGRPGVTVTALCDPALVDAIAEGALAPGERLTQEEIADRLGDRFRLLGYRDDATRLIAGADLFVLASYREGFPRAAMEAAASGVPVVASDIRGCQTLASVATQLVTLADVVLGLPGATIADIDRAFFGEVLPRLNMRDTIIAVTADHSTSCVRAAHTADPVPLMLIVRAPVIASPLVFT